MSRKFLYFSIIILTGCATATPTQAPVKEEPVHQTQVKKITESAKKVLRGLVNVQDEDIQMKEATTGIVFAKTKFEGVLEKRYVELLIESVEDAGKSFELYIGEKQQEAKFPWEVETVKPGYFYVKMPVGKYKISAISIPVGSTVAREPIDVRFEVLPGKILYAGTISLVGTKEKIKLGGVPVIKPGFDFTADIFDEREEAIASFLNRYPEVKDEVSVGLMKIQNDI